MQGLVLSVVLLLALVFPTWVFGFPDGAPEVAWKSDTNPFAPDLSPFLQPDGTYEYIPGQMYTCT